jgi:hypothetical protein
LHSPYGKLVMTLLTKRTFITKLPKILDDANDATCLPDEKPIGDTIKILNRAKKEKNATNNYQGYYLLEELLSKAMKRLQNACYNKLTTELRIISARARAYDVARNHNPPPPYLSTKSFAAFSAVFASSLVISFVVYIFPINPELLTICSNVCTSWFFGNE